MEACERKFFPKSERLFLKKDIERLFDDGQSFISYPLRIVYLSDAADLSSASGISVLIGVPKKRIRKAVQRNRIKRLIREAYRLNKNDFLSHCVQGGKHLRMAFMYVCNETRPYADLEKAVRKAFSVIRQKENL
ncbi:MAG: ribonuclease P protein component [Tannerella sp.]|jgi:ribonuclease P protein component|nr:ribonuclease P protein component [Tannerella sp.]